MGLLNREILSWSYNPRALERNKFKLVLVILAILPCLWLLSGGTVLESFVILILLAGSLSPAFLTHNYMINGKKLFLKNGPFIRRHISLEKVKRLVKSKPGVFISPYEKPSRLDTFHGAFLYLPENVKDAVLLQISEARS